MQYQDYYRVLGVPRDAPAAEIKSAFRKLARKYHPDISKEADAEARMKEINEAYAVLSDAERRAAYDQLGANAQAGQEFRPPPGWDAGFEFSGDGFNARETADFSDFFAEMFGRMGGRQVAGATPVARTIMPRSCWISRTASLAPPGRSRCGCPNSMHKAGAASRPAT